MRKISNTNEAGWIDNTAFRTNIPLADQPFTFISEYPNDQVSVPSSNTLTTERYYGKRGLWWKRHHQNFVSLLNRD